MTPSNSQTSNTSRGKTFATLAIAVLGAIAVSCLVYSHIPAETELAMKMPNAQLLSGFYHGWKEANNVTFGKSEDLVRFKVFSQTYATILEVNSQNLSYTLGLNEFSALTNEEFAATKLGLDTKAMRMLGAPRNYSTLPTANLRQSVDWTTKGAVTGVKNQGACGSCWSFSAVGALEGLSGTLGRLQEFSEQELVDCSTSYGNHGCHGGLMGRAFSYVQDKGIALLSAYPYQAKDSACRSVGGSRFKISGHANVPANNAAQLKAAISKQPVAVAIQADSAVFRSYKSGVLTGSACGTKLNHGVLAVGFETSGIAYYKVKNSWGAGWGDHGFIKIGIEDGAGVCGIQKQASYPTA